MIIWVDYTNSLDANDTRDPVNDDGNFDVEVSGGEDESEDIPLDAKDESEGTDDDDLDDSPDDQQQPDTVAEQIAASRTRKQADK